MGLVGLAFTILTLPGIVLNNIVQNFYLSRYSVPVATVDLSDLEEEEPADDPMAEELDELLGEDDDEESGETAEVVDFFDIEEYSHAFTITLMPFFVCSVLGFAVLLVATPLYESDSSYWLLPFWLGAAFAAHSFPNSVATDALWQQSGETSSPLRFVGYPIVGVSKVINALRFLWVDLLYAVGLFLLARALYVGLLA